MRSIRHMIRTTLLVSGSLLVALSYPMAAFADELPATETDLPTISAPADEAGATSPAPSGSSEPSPAPAATEPSPASTTQDNPASEHALVAPEQAAAQPLAAPITISPNDTGDTPSLAIDSATTTAIANALSASATTGDASVLSNTSAGNATSGDASSIATIINNVNSSMASGSNKQAAHFVQNVMGDVNGDIILQPMLLKAMLEAAAQPADASIQSTNNTAITNDISLNAKSGDAAVAYNTAAGSATSGSANTVANVLNIVNSMIGANQSFIGTINIYGNLNGDILIAPDFIPNLLASNGAAAEEPQAVATASITSSGNTSIVNNIALAATTGAALVSGNTAAGDATSGMASTNAVIFNLTNHEVVASNSLLVFVNVLGKWVGVIIDAPTGATAAAIGNGVTKNTVTPNLVIDSVNTITLTNNITLSSASGDATVAYNTLAGSALSGNATASANVANIVGNSIGLSGWFGVLFINVFGSWVGSFGIDTTAGTTPVLTPAPTPATTSGAQPLRVIQFVPRAASQPRHIAAGFAGVSLPTDGQLGLLAEETGAVRGVMARSSTSLVGQERSVAPSSIINFPLIIIALLFAAGSVFGLYRLGLVGGLAKRVAQ